MATVDKQGQPHVVPVWYGWDGEMILNEVGRIVEKTWQEIPYHFPNVILDAFVIMPNHFHGIIRSDNNPGNTFTPSVWPKTSIHRAIIGSFKSAATKRIHATNGMSNVPIWQRNYYEHIIRNERDHQAIYDCLLTNPQNWAHDTEFMASPPNKNST